ncbi:predicted protein [Thalassiosira pseudonana CCMP1335]|uniref:Uncharacterized protein n=1 Tax=Thalassiosira pseudonana TaxID=35128 RepID=B8CB89_THAPS|nr:predicted protein [Thalassiosira pseudonana CCMP1335]EED89086.1 predicted protein [Thalassiosira pseudonana CCMP1335]|eukprot:g12970.t1 g12970   contig7:572702-574237(-)
MICQSSDIDGYDNFPMGCAFSPDGTCVLTATASDGKFRLYDTPFQRLREMDEGDCGGDAADEAVTLSRSNNSQHEDTTTIEGDAATSATYSHNQNHQAPPHDNSQKQSWNASLSSHQGGPPPPSASSSYSWYPLMNSSSPLTSFYATCRGHSLPIHLIDAYTSQLRASYRPYNEVDELEGPTVVEFSTDGRRLYGTGFKSDRTIAVFDTAVPGREGCVLRLGKTRRSSDGQKGIPSAIAFPKCSSDGSWNGPTNVFAVGTYSPASIYIYDDRMSSPAGTIVLYGGLTVVGHGRSFSRKKRRFAQVDGGQEEEDDDVGNLFSTARVSWFQSRARGGITQLTWAPPTSNNPYVLYSASRRSNAVLSWDVRALSGRDLEGDGSGGRGSKSSYPICGLQSYGRDGDTNQRLDFDLDSTGGRIFVGSGSKEGVVRIYDARSGTLEDEIDLGWREEGLGCRDAVNGVSYVEGFNGGRPLLAVAVGSRRYCEQKEEDEEDDDLDVSPECTGFLRLYRL